MVQNDAVPAPSKPDRVAPMSLQDSVVHCCAAFATWTTAFTKSLALPIGNSAEGVRTMLAVAGRLLPSYSLVAVVTSPTSPCAVSHPPRSAVQMLLRDAKMVSMGVDPYVSFVFANETCVEY